MTGTFALHETGAAEVLAALHARAFPVGERWDVSAMEALLAMPGTMVLVATRNGADDPMGFLMARSSLDEAEILTLAVVPELRRQGVGGALLEGLFARCRHMAVARLFLEVSVRNVAALALYARHGFDAAGLRRAYYPDGADARVLVWHAVPDDAEGSRKY
jgi:ribosomal-protein-alanine N-acetyltransferase